jgi:hypothetical protein
MRELWLSICLQRGKYEYVAIQKCHLISQVQVEDYDKQIIVLREEEHDLLQTKTGLQASKIQMESFNNPKYKALLIDLEERLQIIEEKVQKIREARYAAKQNVANVNIFSHEGLN